MAARAYVFLSVPFGSFYVRLTDLSLSRGEAPVTQRQSGAPLAATNVKTAGSVCKRRDAMRLGRKEGLQPRASERPAVGCSEKLGRERLDEWPYDGSRPGKTDLANVTI